MSKKYNVLYIDGHKSPAAISKDLWLLELYIAQRHVSKKNFAILKEKAHKRYDDPDIFLQYYFGYAVTAMEYRYITSMGYEYMSDIQTRIFDLENTLTWQGKYLKKKDIKKLKKAIKVLKKIDLEKDENFISHMLETVIDRPMLVQEYFDNMQMFINAMEGEDY